MDTLITDPDNKEMLNGLLGSFRNDTSAKGQLVFDLLNEVLEAHAAYSSTSDKPEVPDFNHGIILSLQSNTSHKLYTVEMLVDPDTANLRLMSLESDDKHKAEMNKDIPMTDAMKKQVELIIQLGTES